MNFIIIQNSVKTILIFRVGYIKELLKHGNVIVIAPNDDDKSKRKLESMGVVVEKVSTNRLISIIQMNYFISKYRFKKKTSFICHFLITFLMCYPSLIPFNRKLIIYTEGLGSLFAKKTIFRYLLRFLLIHNHAVRLFCNQSEKQFIGKKSDIVTNGIGIELEKFIKKSSIPSKKYYRLLYIGRLINDKGIRDAIDAFRIISSIRSDVVLTLVGDIYPNNPSSLNENDIQLLKSEFNSNIEFIGFTENVLDWYHSSDILLLPSIREGFPVCVMEASSVGIPTIGYNVPGVRDAIRSGENGELVKFRDVNGIAEKVLSLLNTNKLSYYIERANTYAKNNFSSQEKNAQILKILLDFNTGSKYQI